MGLAAARVPIGPALGSAWTDLQIKAAAIGIIARRCGTADCKRVETFDLAGHKGLPLSTQTFARIVMDMTGCCTTIAHESELVLLGFQTVCVQPRTHLRRS